MYMHKLKACSFGCFVWVCVDSLIIPLVHAWLYAAVDAQNAGSEPDANACSLRWSGRITTACVCAIWIFDGTLWMLCTVPDWQESAIEVYTLRLLLVIYVKWLFPQKSVRFSQSEPIPHWYSLEGYSTGTYYRRRERYKGSRLSSMEEAFSKMRARG